jgi:hypothetical protein
VSSRIELFVTTRDSPSTSRSMISVLRSRTSITSTTQPRREPRASESFTSSNQPVPSSRHWMRSIEGSSTSNCSPGWIGTKCAITSVRVRLPRTRTPSST